MMRFSLFVVVWLVIIVGCGVVTSCADPRVAGVVNGKEIITSAPVQVERPHLRDNVRRSDIVCGDEPYGKLDTQKQINQNVMNKIMWGRECKRKAEIGWKVIEQEP